MKIFFLNGIRAGESVDLQKDQTALGRELDNDINILAEGVSRYHARIDRLNEKTWIIIDLGSTNGIKVNKEKISGSKVLQPGDIVDLGDQGFKLESSEQNTEKPEKAADSNAAKSPSVKTPKDTKQQATQKDSDSNKKEKKTSADAIQLTKNDKLSSAKGDANKKKADGKADKKDKEKIIIHPLSEDVPPVIQPVKNEKESKTEPPVQKIVFQPMSPDSDKKDSPVKSDKPKPKTHKTIPMPPKADIDKKDKTDEKNIDTGISESLIKGLDIFNKDGKDASSSEPSEKGKKRKRSSNLLFYTSVICFAAVFIAVFYGYNKEKNKKLPASIKNPKKAKPFVLYYTKEKATKDNVFRFSLLIEMDKAKFTIDDLKSQRHFSKTVTKINEAQLDDLKKEIAKTSFMALEQPAPGIAANSLDEVRYLTVVEWEKTNTIAVRNTFAPTSFESIEHAIDDLSDFYGMQSIAMTPEELKKLAEQVFYKAEDFYQNREAAPENLLKAVRRYRLVVEYLDQFSPKPRIWNIARKREQEVETIRQKRINDLKFEYRRCMRLKDLKKSRAIASELMRLSSEDENIYKIARKAIMQIDDNQRQRNKR
ncbi:MAG: FHA domain-containing protein [Lentisphaerae bacterium]|nr:FHA domain-containing protein [Lentisphaerota bacterium]MCP4099936.1 FHA domain-containing protein [Lentisphaerota bacterium]